MKTSKISELNQTSPYIPLKNLRFGHEFPDADINSRVAGRESEIEQLAASIKAEGILQSLLVCEDPKNSEQFFVIDGNRRLAAMRKIVSDAGCPADQALDDMPVIIARDIDPIDALRKSFVANDMHLPLHPVDRHAAFAQCHEEGESTAEIAARYAVDERVVRQSLALGRLSPTIRSAWRAGDIDADDAKVFTLSKDFAHQDKVFRKLKKADNLSKHFIRRELVGEQRDINARLIFVGRENYEGAGGAVLEDLFGRETYPDDEDAVNEPVDYEHAVSDPTLLIKLVSEKIQAECTLLMGNGWSWADEVSALPQGASWQWQKLPGVSAKKASAEQKAKSGCIVELNDNGQLDITYGVIKPGGKAAKEEKEKKKAKAKAKGEPISEIPNALALDLVEQHTRAAAKALPADIDVALATLIAGFLSIGMSSVCVQAKGLGNNSDEGDDFLPAFARALKMKRDEKLKTLANIAASSLDFRSGDEGEAAAIFAALPKAAVNLACWENFALADYFERAPKSACLDAIEEAMSKEAVKALAGKKKGDIAAFAAKELKARSWLPHELRTVHYAGPGAKGAKKK